MYFISHALKLKLPVINSAVRLICILRKTAHKQDSEMVMKKKLQTTEHWHIPDKIKKTYFVKFLLYSIFRM